MSLNNHQPKITRRSALALTAVGLPACSVRHEPSPDLTPQGDRAAQAAGFMCWSSRAPLPFAVQEIYPIAHGDRIHLAGGLLGVDGRVVGVSDRHIAYDPASGDSQTLAALPSARHHPQLVSAGGRLYCLGGFETLANMVNWIMSAQTLVYDEADGWTWLAASPEPHAETVAGVLANRIHVIGGRRNTGADNMSYGDHTDSDSHLVYHPDADAWERAAPALTRRNSATGVVIDGVWHVVGGRQVDGGPLDVHEVYDPAEDRWRQAAPMPEGIGAGGNAAGVLNGILYAFGGEFFSGANGGGVHAEVCAYHPASDSWEIVGEMPTPRHGLGGVTLGETIYAVGGATRPSGNGTSAAVESLALTCT